MIAGRYDHDPQRLLQGFGRWGEGNACRDQESVSSACQHISSRQSNGEKSAEEQFRVINEANEVLSDPAKRKTYDQFGADWKHYEEAGAQPGGLDWSKYAGGVGAIAAVITMSSSINGRHGMDKLFACTGVVLAILITAMLSRIVLRGAGSLRRFLAVNGVNSLSRIMGFLLICIGAQFVINGVRDLALDENVWQQ